MALLATSALWAYDFRIGKLCYNITSSSAPYTVEVTYEEKLSNDNYINLSSITIPKTITYDGITYNVTSIDNYAFYRSSLTSITIPNSVTSIGESAFSYCSGLTKTNYTGDIENWCNIKFYGAYSNPIYSSENFYINNNEIKDLVIPNTVDTIRQYTFSNCKSLTSVTISDGVTSIENSAFENCSSLTDVTIGNSVTCIGNSAFEDCSSLTDVTIPNSVISIGDRTFAECFDLELVIIGNSVTSIGDRAFYDSKRRGTYIHCKAMIPPTITNSTFNIDDDYIRVPCDAMSKYKSDPEWKKYQMLSCLDDDEIGTEVINVNGSSQSPNKSEKLFRNGQLIIIRNGVEYNAVGQEM